MAKKQSTKGIPAVERVREVDQFSLLGVLTGNGTANTQEVPCMQESEGDENEGATKLDENSEVSGMSGLLVGKPDTTVLRKIKQLRREAIRYRDKTNPLLK